MHRIRDPRTRLRSRGWLSSGNGRFVQIDGTLPEGDTRGSATVARGEPSSGAMQSYLDALAQRVLVFDGAMGTELMAMHLVDADFGGPKLHGCNEALVLSRPDVVANVHAAYLEAGADVLETNSFTASRLKLDEYGIGSQVAAINRGAAEIARAAADRATTRARPRFVAGSLGPTGMLISSSDPALSKITFEELAAIYGEQAQHLIDGGVDLLLIETSQDLLEMKAAIAGIVRAFDRG